MTAPAYDFPQLPQPGQPGYTPTSGGAGEPSPTVTKTLQPDGQNVLITYTYPNGTTVQRLVHKNESGYPATEVG